MHTKWTAEKRKALNRYIVVIEEPFRVITVIRKAEDDEANARLIAAAPKLLKALRAFVTEYDNLPKEEAQGLIGRIQKLFTNARKAVAKAEE